MNVEEHALRAAKSRNIPITDVVDAVNDRLREQNSRMTQDLDAAIFVGTTEDGWRGGSNGDQVWAMIRNGALKTVMFRRDSQPATPAALRVRTVIA